jgi:hypothetical protein
MSGNDKPPPVPWQRRPLRSLRPLSDKAEENTPLPLLTGMAVLDGAMRAETNNGESTPCAASAPRPTGQTRRCRSRKRSDRGLESAQ